MDNHLKESVVIKNSKGFLYSFYLNESNGVSYSSFDQYHELININNLINKDILEFSACIDNLDNIHLISLSRLGELEHFTCIDGVWSDSLLSTWDVRSNDYKYLSLLACDDNLGFIYCYSNLINSEVWNIEFVSIKPTYEKKNIISVLAGQNFNPYSFDVDKFNDIHLLFCSRENKSNQIYYMNFSPFLNIYKKPPIKVSDESSNNFHPNIFIDSNNQIYALWRRITSNNDADLKCMILKEGENKFKFLNTPCLKNNATHPIMFEENQTLKIVYFLDKSLNSISSKDLGLSWIHSDSITLDYSTLYHSIYSSNSLEDKRIYNINCSYTIIDTSISMFFCNIFSNDGKFIENTVSDNNFVDFNSNLQVNSIDCNYINETISKVEAFLSKNLIKLDSQINLDTGYSEAIKKVEINLADYKNKNNDLVNLLNSINNCSKENSVVIEKLESDLNYLKEQSQAQSSTFFKSLFSKLK